MPAPEQQQPEQAVDVHPDWADPELLPPIIDAVRDAELPHLLESVEACIGPQHEAPPQALEQAGDTSLSNAARTLLLTLLQLARRSRTGAPADGTEALRLMFYIRAQLRTRSVAAASEGEAAAAAPAVDMDSVPGAIRAVYQGLLGRTPSDFEVEGTEGRLNEGLAFHQRVNEVADSPERRALEAVLDNHSDGEFVQRLYEAFLDRGATAPEIKRLQDALAAGATTRLNCVQQFSREALESSARPAEAARKEALAFRVWGTDEKVTLDDWHARAQTLRSAPPAAPRRSGQRQSAPARFSIGTSPKLVTAIASLYAGGAYIEQFLDNICSQSIFNDCCELVIIDANSPDSEAETIERYTRAYDNIVYRRMNYRISVYEAWNAGVELASGEYLTNTNLDDLRREDSFELQAATLDALPFVDTVYQDFYFTFDPHLSFDEIAAFGYKTDLPVITPHNMLVFNPPHNAPMWRQSLHRELGGFDTTLWSAGDYEFWLRCLAAGKRFYKLNEPHVAYYQNPEGLSTRSDSTNDEESRRIRKQYARQLMPSNVVCDRAAFRQELGLPPSVPGHAGDDSRYDDVQMALRNLAMRSPATAQSG